MKTILTISLALCSMLLFTQCEKASMRPPDLLKQKWVDSSEEASDSEAVFRPADYKDFPIRRFRFVMELKDQQKCSYLVLAPNDAHYPKDGRWTYNSKTRTIKIMDGKTTVYEFVVVELGEDILKVKR